jgi:glycosyltransferase involved in cell wall biosynthesis
MDSRDPDSVRIASPGSVFHGVRTRAGEWNGVPYVQVGCWGAELEFQRYSRRRVLTELLKDCDLIQVVCGSPAWANAVTGLGKPVSLLAATRVKVERRMRDSKPKGLSGLWRKMMTRVTDRLDDRALRNVDAIQVLNPWMLEYVREINMGREVDIRYAPSGVDSVLFHPLPERSLLGKRQILCVGRLHDPRKNVGLLLEAYARLPDSMKASTELLLAGAFGPPISFWDRAETLGLGGRVRYVARPDQMELASLYRNAAIFSLPSDEEGFGVVILEAMASGVPVVSTRSGGPDGIITDGKDGFLVPLDDVELLALRLRYLLESLEENLRMGQEARRTVEERYAKDVAGREFIRMWERLYQDSGINTCGADLRSGTALDDSLQ